MIKIETKRCIVRCFLEKDIEAFMGYRNDEVWMQHQDFKGRSKEEYEKALLKESSLEEGMQLAIVIKTNQELIGDLYLKQCEDTFWMGYTINPAYARQGYTYEATRALIEWIIGQGSRKVYAGVLPENIASIQLLKKLGFHYTETDEYGDKIYQLEV